MPAKRKKTDRVQINVRMREGLRRKIERSAKAEDVSMNAEIIERLEGSYDDREMFEDRGLYRLGQMLGIALIVAERKTGGSVFGDDETNDVAASAVKELVRQFQNDRTPLRYVPPHLVYDGLAIAVEMKSSLVIAVEKKLKSRKNPEEDKSDD